jgi:transposase
MPRPYSLDLRERVLAARAAGRSVTEIVTTFQVSRRTVNRWQHRHDDETIGLAPTPLPGRQPLLAVADDPALIAMVTADPDATLQDYCDRWTAQHGQRVSVPTMWRRLRQLGLTRKKRPLSPASRMPGSAPSGALSWRSAIPASSSSSTKPTSRSG